MTKEKLIKNIWLLLSLLCFLIIVSIFIFYKIKYPTENSFGERYVKDEIPLFFPFYPIFYLKPITLIGFLGFLSWCFMVEDLRNLFYYFSKQKLQFLFIIFLFFSLWIFYEIVWDFYAWFSIWQMRGGNLDLVSHKIHPTMKFPINFVFVTKIYFMIFGICIYTLYFFHNILSSNVNRKPI